jgi:hypothetical protein
MPNLNHLTHGISNLVSLITKTKLELSLRLLQRSELPLEVIDGGGQGLDELVQIGCGWFSHG